MSLLHYNSSRFLQNLKMHGAAIAHLAYAGRTLQYQKSLSTDKPHLSKSEIRHIKNELARIEEPHIFAGVDFSRIQIDEVLRQRDQGTVIEFETLGPYMADYAAHDYRMQLANLTPEDTIGLELARVLHKAFPKARLIALCDDYNTTSAHSLHTGERQVQGPFSAAAKQQFKESLVALFKATGAIAEKAVEGKAYLLLDESAKTGEAQKLIELLEQHGYIRRNGKEISFCNNYAENPLYQTVRLRTKEGRWTCEALDAASFLQPANPHITHLVILPSYMKPQQDKAWEMLRVLGIPSDRYHNIFYDPNLEPKAVAQTVATAFDTSV